LNSPGPLDPNLIPVSPSGSALHKLSLYEPAPSLTASESRSSLLSSPQPPSEATPPSDAIPEIPDYNSKSTKQTIIPVPPPKKSKLSLLASSRASSVTSRTESSRSSGIALTGSVKTFPALRPSAQSVKPPSSVASSSLGGENAEYYNASSTAPSSTESHIRRAIQTAMNQEAGDKEAAPKTSSSPGSRASSDKSKTPTPAKPVALPTVQRIPRPPFPEGQAVRQPSKLALLAQAKADASKAPKIPKPTTEYLMPIANGSSVTTAITTSYQSLYSLTDPTRSPIIPKQYVVPLGIVAPSSPETKKSKLAMKVKKAHEKQYLEPEGEVITPPVSPMFYPKSTRARASPSAFASLLIDDRLTISEDNEDDRAAHQRAREQRHKEKQSRASVKSDDTSVRSEKSTQSRTRRQKLVIATPSFSLPMGFAFDGPSPDDVVFNARRGTSLGQQKNTPSTANPRLSPAAAKPVAAK
jgi:hypothetical protein